MLLVVEIGRNGKAKMLGSKDVRNHCEGNRSNRCYGGGEKRDKSAWSLIMKIIMFEENVFESFSNVFSELVNQTSYNLFGNKPSCRLGQYQTFCVSKMSCSSFIVVQFA